MSGATQTCDIAIVGGGMGGLATAATLGRLGVHMGFSGSAQPPFVHYGYTRGVINP